MTTAPYETLDLAREPASPHSVQRVIVGGLPIVRMTREEQASYMIEDWRARRSSKIQSPPKIAISINGNVISLYHRDPAFRAAVDQADMLDADGMSVVFASRLFSRAGLPERVATTDFFHDAARRAGAAGMSFYFLGAEERESIIATENVKRLYPGLRIAGRRNGYFTEADEADICADVIASGADVLWVGRGSPTQELFAARNRERLTGLAWIKTCGGLFDFLSGKNPRAPQWMQNAGIEFAYRTWREPRRLFWRYLMTCPHALYLMARKTRSV